MNGRKRKSRFLAYSCIIMFRQNSGLKSRKPLIPNGIEKLAVDKRIELTLGRHAHIVHGEKTGGGSWVTLDCNSEQNFSFILAAEILTISYFPERIVMEHIDIKVSSESELQILSICSIRTHSRKADIFDNLKTYLTRTSC